MSFILDALKKSETDRQRQSGPALFEVKVAPPRSRLPLWALALGVLLAVNIVIVAWVLIRRPAAHVDAVLASAPVAAPAEAPPPARAAAALPAPSAPAAAAHATAAAATAPATTPPADDNAPAQVAPAGPAAAAPLAAANVSGADEGSPEDQAPAADAPPPGQSALSHVRRATADGVPLYQDIAAAPGSHLPPLRLDLHVYAQRPQDRFVMINMKKMREGDSLPEGVHLDSITPEGAVLTYDGAKFLLPRD